MEDQRFEEFINEIKKFKKNRILKEEIRELIKSEEETKLKLINPFLKILGYDVEEPGVLVSEDIADFRNKKGKKVDYIAYKEDSPIMLIEAKYHKNQLSHSTEQLDTYFNAKVIEGCRLGLLTNGVEYRFFSDLDNDNKLDEEPFFVFDLKSFSDKDIKTLQHFMYDKINTEEIQEIGKRLKHYNQVLEILKKEIKNPSDNLISLFVKEISGRSRITPSLIEEFRGYFKEAFEEIISSSQKDSLHHNTQETPNIPNNKIQDSNPSTPSKITQTYTEEDHLKDMPEKIVKMYETAKMGILNLGNIDLKPKRLYIGFTYNNKFIASFVILRSKVRIFLDLKYSDIVDPRNKIRDVSKTGHWGSGDCEFIYEDIEDMEYLLSFIKQSYNKNK